MQRKIRVMLLKQNKGALIPQEIPDFIDDLEHLYEALECRCIDIQSRKVGGRLLDFVFDDEYLFTAKPDDLPTAIFEGEGQEAIFGNLIITGTGDQEGNLTSLCDLDIEAILSNISQYRAKFEGKEGPNLSPIFLALRYGI